MHRREKNYGDQDMETTIIFLIVKSFFICFLSIFFFLENQDNFDINLLSNSPQQIPNLFEIGIFYFSQNREIRVKSENQPIIKANPPQNNSETRPQNSNSQVSPTCNHKSYNNFFSSAFSAQPNQIFNQQIVDREQFENQFQLAENGNGPIGDEGSSTSIFDFSGYRVNTHRSILHQSSENEIFSTENLIDRFFDEDDNPVNQFNNNYSVGEESKEITRDNNNSQENENPVPSDFEIDPIQHFNQNQNSNQNSQSAPEFEIVNDFPTIQNQLLASREYPFHNRENENQGEDQPILSRENRDAASNHVARRNENETNENENENAFRSKNHQSSNSESKEQNLKKLKKN